MQEERGIKLEVGFKYLKVVKYRIVDNKEFYSLGFKNKSGGWALRNKHFTRAIAPNDITVFDKSFSIVKCFEGFIDFFLMLTLSGLREADTDIIVLNSVSLKEMAIDFIKGKNYSEIHTYFDNDEAGRKTLQHFKKELNGLIIKTFNHLYEGYKDYNDLLINTKYF